MPNTLLPILLCGVLIDAAFIVTEYRKKLVAAVILKGLASVAFVLLGLVCYQKTGDRTFGLLVVIGLCFGAVGDVLLNLRFVLTQQQTKIFACGIAAFLLGHLLYIAALFFRDARAALIGVPVAAVLALLLIPQTLKRINAPGKLRVFGVVYLAIVILMFGCAASLFVLQPGDSSRILFAVGALLFLASDMVLVFDQFGKTKRKPLRAVNLSLYYIGQLLIALCLLFC